MTPFGQFIQERRYLNNVSERSIEWYGFAFKWLQSENPTQADLKQSVIKMREHGLTARSVNSSRTAINAYLHWLSNPEIKWSPSCQHPRIARMQAERKILPVYSPSDVAAFAKWKPKKYCQRLCCANFHSGLNAMTDGRETTCLVRNQRSSDFHRLVIFFEPGGKGGSDREDRDTTQFLLLARGVVRTEKRLLANWVRDHATEWGKCLYHVPFTRSDCWKTRSPSV